MVSRSEDMVRIRDLVRSLNALLMDFEPGLASYHTAVLGKMSQLRDAIDVVLRARDMSAPAQGRSI